MGLDAILFTELVSGIPVKDFEASISSLGYRSVLVIPAETGHRQTANLVVYRREAPAAARSSPSEHKVDPGEDPFDLPAGYAAQGPAEKWRVDGDGYFHPKSITFSAPLARLDLDPFSGSRARERSDSLVQSLAPMSFAFSRKNRSIPPASSKSRCSKMRSRSPSSLERSLR